MRVGIFLQNIQSPERGGSYTFQDSIIQALLKAKSKHELVVFHKGPSFQQTAASETLSFVSLDRYQRSSWRDYLPGPVLRMGRGIRKVGGFIAGFPPPDRSPALRRAARDQEVSMMWFPTPGFIETGLPYITTVWDLGHRLIPMFPEVRRTGYKWESREEHYRTVLRKAAYVITGTETGKNQIRRYYQVDAERIRVNPFPTPSFAKEATSIGSVPLDLPERFLFYPAQFWPHKNHVLILGALKELRAQGIDIQVVFTGSDKGNLSYIKETAREKGIADLVRFPGFVSRDTLTYLYQNALALVFVTFLGPDNLPPLEAFALGCPVIASDIPGAGDQMGDAAIRIDPTSVSELTAAIRRIYESPDKRSVLEQRGRDRAAEWLPEDYVSRMFNLFDESFPYRRCWDPADDYEHL